MRIRIWPASSWSSRRSWGPPARRAAPPCPSRLPPPPAATGVPNTGPIALTIWDQESGPPSSVWDRLNAEFEAKYPNVTIKRVNRDFGELKTLLKLAISGPHAPDVVEANQGWPDMGQLVKAGLLLPLDNYAKAYGWDEKVSENVRAVSTWSPDGKEFGTGSLFGYTTMGEIVGVYYNKAMLADLGLTIPATFDEFEQDLDVAKRAGEVPIQFGNNDAFPGDPRVRRDPGPDGVDELPHGLHLRAQEGRALLRHAGERGGRDHTAGLGEGGLLHAGVRRRRLRQRGRQLRRRARGCS